MHSFNEAIQRIRYFSAQNFPRISVGDRHNQRQTVLRRQPNHASSTGPAFNCTRHGFQQPIISIQKEDSEPLSHARVVR